MPVPPPSAPVEGRLFLGIKVGSGVVDFIPTLRVKGSHPTHAREVEAVTLRDGYCAIDTGKDGKMEHRHIPARLIASAVVYRVAQG